VPGSSSRSFLARIVTGASTASSSAQEPCLLRGELLLGEYTGVA
jgi:hypothetical protein